MAKKRSHKLFNFGVVVLVAVVGFAIFDNVKHNFYVFDPETLAKLAREVIRKNYTMQELVPQLVKSLEK